MPEIDEAAIKAAIKARRHYIISNLETMSLKTCRETLEQDLGLPAGALKPYKPLLSKCIDKLLEKRGTEQRAAAPDASPEQGQGGDSKEGGGEGKEKPRKAAKQHTALSAPAPAWPSGGSAGSRKRSKGAAAAEEEERCRQAKHSGSRQHGCQIEKLRSICKAATITIPPNLYARNKGEAELQHALEELLGRHGLDAQSGEREIARARSKLQMQRDLDGIDATNIIEGGRRRRAAAAAAVSYRAMVLASASDSDMGEDEEEDEEEEGAHLSSEAQGSEQADEQRSDSDAEQSGAQPHRQQRKMTHKGKIVGPVDDDDSDNSEDDAENCQAAGDAPLSSCSPDENLANGLNGRSSNSSKAAASKAGTARVPHPASRLQNDGRDKPAIMASKRRALMAWSDDDHGEDA